MEIPANFKVNDAGSVVPVATAANGKNAAGTHFNGGVETDVTRQLIPGLITCPFDSEVVKMGWSTTPINAMTREVGFKPLKAMEYGYYSVDLRDCEDKVKTAPTINAAAVNAQKPTAIELEVYDVDKFDVTDVIVFNKLNASGVQIAARVSAKESGKLKIQLLNAAATDTLPAATKIYILGHAASETDASTTPYAALPTEGKQYMQKFMVQSLISTVMMESEKEVNWGKADINELLMQQFIEDVEKTYIWGVKSYTFDPSTKLYTRTTSGIVEQMLLGGAHNITLTKTDGKIKKSDLIDAINEVFEGNSGSTKRYMFMGNAFATAFFNIDSISEWVNANDTVRKFEYDFTQVKLFGNVVLCTIHPLLSKMGWSDRAFILDRQYVERRVFRSMDETALELQKTGAYDGESSVWSEISSIVLKYPKCHALLKLA